MEIALLNNTSLRIKGKGGSLIINPAGKAYDANGFIAHNGFSIDTQKMNSESLIINGPGEYEFGGIKVTGIRYADDMIYTIYVDKISILFGKAEVFEREYSKLNEVNIVILDTANSIDPSFITSIASNVAVFYGGKSNETIKLLAKEEFRIDSKYSVSFEKLPQELEKIELAN